MLSPLPHSHCYSCHPVIPPLDVVLGAKVPVPGPRSPVSGPTGYGNPAGRRRMGHKWWGKQWRWGNRHSQLMNPFLGRLCPSLSCNLGPWKHRHPGRERDPYEMANNTPFVFFWLVFFFLFGVKLSCSIPVPNTQQPSANVSRLW